MRNSRLKPVKAAHKGDYRRRKIFKSKIYIISILILIFGTGGGWWDGLDVDRSRYDRSYHFGTGGASQYRAAGVELAEELSNIPLRTLIARCRMVIREDHRAERVRREGTHVLGPGYIDFLICFAAIHRIGETKNKSWLPVLDEFASGVGRTKPGEYLTGEVLQVARMSLTGQLQIAIGQSYKNMLLSDATPEQIVQGWRQAIIELPRGKAARYGYAQARQELFYQEPHDPEFVEAFLKLFSDENPEIRLAVLNLGHRGAPIEAYDLRVAALADPDPRVRDLASRDFHGKKEYLVPSLIRLLSRDDIDDSARNTALDKLASLDFKLETGPDGELKAVPIDSTEKSKEPDKDEILFLLRLIRHEDAGTAKRTDAINKLRQYGYSFGPGPDGSVMASPFRPNLEPVILPPDE